MGILAKTAFFLTFLLFFFDGEVFAQIAPRSGEAATAEPDLPSLHEQLSPEAIRDMVARMSDDEVRAMLLARLDAVAAATEETPEGYVGTINQLVPGIWVSFYTPIMAAVFGLPDLLSKQAEAFANFAAAFGGTGVFRMLGLLVVALGVGYLAEIVVTKIIPRRRKRLAAPNTDSLRSTLAFLARRLVREVFGLTIFYVVLRTIGQALFTPWQIVILAPAVRFLILIPRLISALSRFVLAPEDSRLRLLSVDDRWAKYIHRNLIGLGFLGGLTVFIVGFNEQFGVPDHEAWIGFWLNLAFHTYMVILAWTAREGLSDMMRGNDPDRSIFDEQIARIYPYFVIAVSIATWVVATIVAGSGRSDLLVNAPHYTTMFWLLMAPLIDTAIRGLVWHIQPPMIGEGQNCRAGLPVEQAQHDPLRTRYRPWSDCPHHCRSLGHRSHEPGVRWRRGAIRRHACRVRRDLHDRLYHLRNGYALDQQAPHARKLIGDNIGSGGWRGRRCRRFPSGDSSPDATRNGASCHCDDLCTAGGGLAWS